MAARKQTQAAAKGGLSNAQKIILRDAAVEKIEAALADQPLSVSDIATRLGIPMGTAYRYLCYMAEMGDARRTVDSAGTNRQMWELGREELAELEYRPQRHEGVTIVPARQVGMQRHPQDVAFFGPARVDLITTSAPCAGHAKPLGK